MRKLRLYLLLTSLALIVSSESVCAQWTQVFQLQGTFAASAFFFNATEGMIGTGTYRPRTSTIATIYITNDGGTSWHKALFPNPNVIGQVTDIYFKDRQHGWATLSEGSSKGWGGLYRSSDGGETWRFLRPAGNAGGVRETSRGIFYTDRTAGPSGTGGIVFSGDDGKTWRVIATTDYPLGIDFMDDLTGLVTAQGNSLGLHLMTTDGGVSWNSVPASWNGAGSDVEAWTPFGDPITRKFFIASEHWPLGSNIETSLFTTPVKNALESPNKTYNDSGLTGGIAGSRSCKSVVYAQGWSKLSTGPRGFIRSMDGGASWVPIAGPMNLNDTRFAVTGRGAVVFAGDASGGVWRTTNGGDGTLSSSSISFVGISPQNSNAPNGCYAAPICDSIQVPVRLDYSACDSMKVVSVEFPDDTAHELSVPDYLNNYHYFSHQSTTLTLLYRPTRQESWTARVTITFRQPDGYLEDTTISVLFNGTSPQVDPLIFSETTSRDSIDFGPVSLCADADHKVTILNTGCGNVSIQTMQVNGGQFSLASNFNPFVLSPGTSRTFLVHYKPSGAGSDQGSFFIKHSAGQDAVILTGTGFAPNKTVSLQFDSVFSRLCDSTNFIVKLRNVACTPFKLLSVSADTPFTAGPLPLIDSLRQGETTDLRFTFTPMSESTIQRSIHIRVGYEGVGPSYDTTITIDATGTSGRPDIAILNNRLDFGSVSVCSEAQDTLYLQGTGCGDVSLSAQFDKQVGFSFVKAPKPMLKAGEFDTVIVRFHPSQSPGPQTANIILTTSAGPKTVVSQVFVTQDPGTITLSASPNVHAYTCQTAPFSFTLHNTTCDSLIILKAVLSGASPQDFTIDAFNARNVYSGDSATFSGTFSPQDSVTSSAIVMLTIQKPDGSTYTATVALDAAGIGVPPIKVALNNTTYHGNTASTVTIPVYAVTGSVVKVNSFDFTLRLNRDLLTPIRVISGKGSFGRAATSLFDVRQDSVRIQLTLPSDIDLTPGEICEIECQPFVASALSTLISIGNSSFNNQAILSQCFSSSAVTDSFTSFVFDRGCGDTVMALFLRSGVVTVDRVAPNPTLGEVTIDFRVPSNYQNDAVLDVYDVLGTRLHSIPLVFGSGGGAQAMTVDLRGGQKNEEGIRYLRIRTPSQQGSDDRSSWSPLLSAKVILWK